jgi:hypothetical protein
VAAVSAAVLSFVPAPRDPVKPEPETTEAVLYNGEAFTPHRFERVDAVKTSGGKLLAWRFMFRCTASQRLRVWGNATPFGAPSKPGRAA